MSESPSRSILKVRPSGIIMRRYPQGCADLSTISDANAYHASNSTNACAA